VQVMLQDGVLCITGERRVTGGGEGGYYRREWHYGSFERGFALPEGSYRRGHYRQLPRRVLEVVVPKAVQRAEPGKIPVSAADGKTALPIAQHAA
jgi:HSP20 family molecular chaperone IbpA